MAPDRSRASRRHRPTRRSAGVSPHPSTIPRPQGPRTPEWEVLTRAIVTCERCPLHRTRTHAVVYRGGSRPSVVFVGEAPGAAEDAVGLPFVGAAGRRLDAAIVELGLQPDDVGVVNVLKCRPPGNRFDRHAATTCAPYLHRQLDQLRPRIVVTLGAYALEALDPAAPSVTTAAGSPRPSGTRTLFPLIHPAAPLHAPRLRQRWVDDLGRLREFLRGIAAQNV